MKRGLWPWGGVLLGALAIGLLGACEGDEGGTAPPPYTPLIESVELTLNLDAGAPVALEADGERLAIAYSCLFEGSGDIFRLVVDDADGDGLYEHYSTVEEYPNANDPEVFYLRSDHQQFTAIGDYEVEDGSGSFPSDPGTVYFSGPRQLSYDAHTDRLFYSMGYGGISQIASTVAPSDGAGGHIGDIVNSYDESLADFSNTAGRPPVWEFWYTKKRVGADWRFSGGNHASVSPPMVGGHQWLAYADTLLERFDRDGDGKISEDPVGEIEVIAGGASDAAPGIVDQDDDADGGKDFNDLQVAAMLVTNPAPYSYAWMLQNYLPAWDDDEDGLIDEDLLDLIDNDGDGQIDEDQPGDMNGDGYPGGPGDEATDTDLLGDLLDLQVKHANTRALAKEDYDPVRDDDEDGISDEDAEYSRNGIWVVRIGAGGLPDTTVQPISLTNDRGRQPFFNPTGSDLIYVQNGDIHRLPLAFTADEVNGLSPSTNLTNSAALEAYPAYADDGGRIVYSSSQYGSADLFIREADGTVHRVTNAPGQELFARFTPDGRQLLYEGWLFPAGLRRVMITVEPLPE